MLTRVLTLATLLCLSAASALAQGNPTGTITGQVTSDQGPLPGVAVTARSPALQVPRTVTTSANGDFNLPVLPTGDYTLRFELSGFGIIEQHVRVSPGRNIPINLLMVPSAAAEITVEGERVTVTRTAPATAVFDAVQIEKLPLDRTLASTLTVAPGVHNTGPSGNVTISGAMSFESLYLINGVVVNENIRGQSLPLFIEDAIQETTISSGTISAEFGRFGGGVVNLVTKSGGNKFSGTFRTSFTNDDWRTITPFGETKVNDTVPSYEATIGGPILKDSLWFFFAGRSRNATTARTTGFTNLPFTNGDDEKRIEGKITYSLGANHLLRGSFSRIDRTQTNNTFLTVMDERSFDDRKLPQDLLSLNYTGVFGMLATEFQFAQRRFTFSGSGGTSTDLIEGTVVTDRQRNAHYWAPFFCGVCRDEKRDNRNFLAKGSYFLSSKALGAHNFIFGYDNYDDIRVSDNHQSGSDYRVQGTTSILRDGTVYPVFNNNDTTLIQWWPILEASRGTSFKTHSAFFNDSWRLNRFFSFNLGVRYDRNNGSNAAGVTVAKDSAWSPRLSVSIDPTGDETWKFSFGAARYVSALANSIADSSSAGGRPALLGFFYRGPSINPDASAATLIPTDQALRTAFDWFFANGGTDGTPVQVSIPGVDTEIRGSLASPSVREWSFAVSRALGTRGTLRADTIVRNYQDFYSTRNDISTGTVSNERGQIFDLKLVENTNTLDRRYLALQFNGSYRLSNAIEIGGNWTVSRSFGNFNGETAGSGPVTSTLAQYPEYKEARWNSPDGDLSIDQRHRIRLWGNFKPPFPARLGTLSLAVLQSYSSGTPYGGVAAIDPRPYVTNPGYRTPPPLVDYYFTARDAFRTEAATSTDLALNYAFQIGQRTRGVELFLQAHMLNLFDETALSDSANINTNVLTRSNSTDLQAFNPFTSTPVEGVNWRFAPEFGKAINRNAYQTPRTFRFSTGARF